MSEEERKVHPSDWVVYTDYNRQHWLALVHRVHDDVMVNLTAFTDFGTTIQTSVKYDAGRGHQTWCWPSDLPATQSGPYVAPPE